MLKRLLRKIIYAPFFLVKKIIRIIIRKLIHWKKKAVNYIRFFFFENFELYAEYNMTLKSRELKRQRRKLSLIYHLIVFFIFFSFLMFYDVADEDQYLFIYEFHKWW